jgi:hypothetical protein
MVQKSAREFPALLTTASMKNWLQWFGAANNSRDGLIVGSEPQSVGAPNNHTAARGIRLIASLLADEDADRQSPER